MVRLERIVHLRGLLFWFHARPQILSTHHSRVQSIALEQLAMGTLLDDLSISHDSDIVRSHHRSEFMRNDERGLVRRDAIQGVLHCLFRA